MGVGKGSSWAGPVCRAAQSHLSKAGAALKGNPPGAERESLSESMHRNVSGLHVCVSV